MKTTPNLHRQRFFDRQVHMPVWKKSMAGENEERIINIFNQIGFFEGSDFVRQHPIGERFVIDFAFVSEQFAIEVDGTNHDEKKQKALDKRRDSYLRTVNWVPLRIREEDLRGERGSFYKSLIKEIVEERRKQWQGGKLYEIEIPRYEEADFE